MGLQNMQILSGATVSATGGTAMVFGPDSVKVDGGVHLVDTGATSFITQANVTAKVKQPTLLTDGRYSKDKKSILLVEPMVDSKGMTVFNLIEIRREVHPELPAADAVKLLNKGAQLCFDADLTAFWANGSLS